MSQSHKICPQCKTTAHLQAASCIGCGRVFRTTHPSQAYQPTVNTTPPPAAYDVRSGSPGSPTQATWNWEQLPGVLFKVAGAILLWVIVTAVFSKPDPAVKQRQANASAIFQRKLTTAMTEAGAGSAFTYRGTTGMAVEVVVDEGWYQFTQRQKELMVESIAGVWLAAREDAGIKDEAARVELYDSSHNNVAEWGSVFGTKVKR